MSNTSGTSGTKVSISSTQVTASTDTASEYAALTWVEIDPVETIGKFGDQAASVKFTSLKDSRVRKSKGPRDAGTVTLLVGYDAADPGQIALIAAEKTNKKYAFKVEFADAPTTIMSNTIVYFRALVMSDPFNAGSATDTTRREFDLDIDSELIEVVPA